MHTPLKFSLVTLAFIPFMVGCVNAQSDHYRSTSANYQQQEYASPELDALLAPIALYPDTLLSHILIASTYPLEVVQADRWVKAHPNLTGDNAIAAAVNEPWDASVKALVAFPDVLERMSSDLRWTEELGDAFLEDEQFVMASVQRLRNRAYDAGNLADTQHVNIVRENSIVVIEPRHTNVIYTPYYDTRVVYGDWWWPDYPPTYWYAPPRVAFHQGFYWGPSIRVSSGFFFSGFNWHSRRLLVVDRPHLHRPIYSSHTIIRHQHARHWQHNPVHRRGMAYREGPAYNRFRGATTRPAQPPRRPAGSEYRPGSSRPQVDRTPSNRPSLDRNRDRPENRPSLRSERPSGDFRSDRNNQIRANNPERENASTRRYPRDNTLQGQRPERPRANTEGAPNTRLEETLRERTRQNSLRATHDINRPSRPETPNRADANPRPNQESQRPTRPNRENQEQMQRPTQERANRDRPAQQQRQVQQQRPTQQQRPAQPQRSFEQRPQPQRNMQQRPERESLRQQFQERREQRPTRGNER